MVRGGVVFSFLKNLAPFRDPMQFKQLALFHHVGTFAGHTGGDLLLSC